MSIEDDVRRGLEERITLSARRIGKSDHAAVVILYRLFVLREPETVFTAPWFDAVKCVFDEVITAIDRAPGLQEQVQHVRRTGGQWAILLKPDRAAGELRGPKVEFKPRRFHR